MMGILGTGGGGCNWDTPEGGLWWKKTEVVWYFPNKNQTVKYFFYIINHTLFLL